MNFNQVINQYREEAFSERDKGDRFERLTQAFLNNYPPYEGTLDRVWLWKEFPYRKQFGGSDIGIDLVALTAEKEFWAVQCKCYAETAQVDKPALDSFLSTSSKLFNDDSGQERGFSNRLVISTTNKWSGKAEEAITHQAIPVQRIDLYHLEAAPLDWKALAAGISGDKVRSGKKSLRPHQTEAVEATHQHFQNAKRGKLIMACGTGKTFTALRIAEKETGGNGLVLFLVPSIGLLGQTLNEWMSDKEGIIHPICICSDPKTSRKKSKNEDSDSYSVVDLALPATTDPDKIVSRLILFKEKKGMTVVFSTYQSIEVISKALKQAGGVFDLIICDEAHRTTGVTLSSEDESAFVKVHDNNFLKAKKRLYMTATPRLYDADSKTKAKDAEALLCSMDDPALYGEEIYRIGFGEAVEHDLLSDYRVLILTLNENDVSPSAQQVIADGEGKINIDDASKLIGCLNALSKQIIGDDGITKEKDAVPMQRAVAFCPSIRDSKNIAETFNGMREGFVPSLTKEERDVLVNIEADHIDGTMSAPRREELLGWLKRDIPEGECRVLHNVRCLSEGIDMPSLDAVLFLSARNSPVDVVQSVGRVMRKAPGKKYGYIVIPVVVPFSEEAHKALDNNKRYKVVWTVLNALRAHDDRFNAIVNKIELNTKKGGDGKVNIVNGTIGGKEQGGEKQQNGEGGGEDARNRFAQQYLPFEELQNLMFARMVQKVGDRRYWEQWAADVAEIARKQTLRINTLIKEEGKQKTAFEKFLKGLRKNINPSISSDEAVEMLSQHLITQPVFEALFEDYSFVKNNPISQSMALMLKTLEGEHIEKETETLEKFYQSVRKRAEGIDNGEGKQRIIIELYDKFFRTAFPQMVERLGIVYTPVEMVDFIIRSVEELLRREFGRGLTDENVHILDPFTGTGTFITRLLQSGLIEAKDLQRKFNKELHANEIVLLAYYIAAINAENAYHDQIQGEYHPFSGICLTDTFQLGETDEGAQLFSEIFPQNSERVAAQKKAPLRVIMGNPPYSAGQKSANDNAQNMSYKKLEDRIAKTYAAGTKATNKNSLYDSYIKAFRWSSDRLDKNGGVIAFVSNAGWLDGNAMNGFRECLRKEFSAIYVFNLRGNARTSGDIRRKEAGNIFGHGSRTPISITLLVKKPEDKGTAVIHYRDIGDYLSRDRKLEMIRGFGSLGHPDMRWKKLKPDEKGDWLNQGSEAFEGFIALGDKKGKSTQTFFMPFYSNGVKTQRDAWCYNSSQHKLEENIRRTIDFYNEQIKSQIPKDKLEYDSKQISWTQALIWDVEKEKQYRFESKNITTSYYRPFYKQKLYFSRSLNERVYQIPKLFPTPEHKNLVICVTGKGAKNESLPIITDHIPDLNCLEAGAQCFPLYYYEENIKNDLFDENSAADEHGYIRRDGVSDYILKEARSKYGGENSKEDIFYYVYGFLHSPDYRTAFANDLKKSLPRLPLVESAEDFQAFNAAGRRLAELHIGYESVEPCAKVRVIVDGKEEAATTRKYDEHGNMAAERPAKEYGSDSLYKVEKMRFPTKEQKDTIIYNPRICLEGIPERAYEYVVNGKSAIEWVMERYQVTTHKESGIKNDPNDWCRELGDGRYILDLLLRVVTVSLETVEIVEGLPSGFGGLSGK